MQAYIYIATPTEWGNSKNEIHKGFKVGYTARANERNKELKTRTGYTIRAIYPIEIPCERVGVAVEHLAQTYYTINYEGSVKPIGDDYFKANKAVTTKAVKQFTEVAQRAYSATMMMSNIK